MTFRIALIGTSDSMKTQLANILRNNEFAVDVYDPNTVSSPFDCRLHTYDVVIASAGLAAGFKIDAVFMSLLIARGFLIFEETEENRSEKPSFVIHSSMSPEDIIAVINNVLYLNSNKRRSPRMRINQPVEYEYEGKHFQSAIHDLSESGVFIISLAPPRDGTKITLRFSLPGGDHDIVAAGRVVYGIVCNLDQGIISHPSSLDKKIVALPGIGVTFEEISDSAREAIKDFMMKHQ